MRIYAPLAGASLRVFVRKLRFAVPQWRAELNNAFERARERLAHARAVPPEEVRLLAPTDPLVRDRERFETL